MTQSHAASMHRRRARRDFLVGPTVALVSFLATLAAAGCASRMERSQPILDDRYLLSATAIEYPDVEEVTNHGAATTAPPRSLSASDLQNIQYWDLSLEEAVALALEHSTVLRDLGGLVLQQPGAVRTTSDAAIQETDPRYGVEAALSAFDAMFEASGFFENNDRALNNSFFGGGTRLFKQDLSDMQAQISKRSATGADYTLRHSLNYDANNAPGNRFPSAWTAILEAEVRQPLLQGAGIDFNRIYGPNGQIGLPRGVLLARIDTDVSLADFEIGVRDFVSDIENAYWELYYAYRDLDAKIAARDRALETWRVIRGWYELGRAGGEADQEAQAREQYFRLELDVQNALAGRIPEPSRANTFRGNGGVYAAERRLRRLIGLPINDDRLIRPADEPSLAPAAFDWNQIQNESLRRRAELRRQKWKIRRRELEVAATKNFLLPKLDLVSRYRFRGFGKDLLNPGGSPVEFDNAYENLTSGDFQEWQLGFEYKLPIGLRQAHVALRNAQLQLAREHQILEDQEAQVVHDLSNAMAEIDRAFQTARTAFNRLEAGRAELSALQSLYRDPNPDQVARLIDRLLDAQRRVAEAESQYARARVEYALAIKNLHFQKGSLLEYSGVYLSEGPWSEEAQQDALERAQRRKPAGGRPQRWNHPPSVGRGPDPDHLPPTDNGGQRLEVGDLPSSESGWTPSRETFFENEQAPERDSQTRVPTSHPTRSATLEGTFGPGDAPPPPRLPAYHRQASLPELDYFAPSPR